MHDLNAAELLTRADALTERLAVCDLCSHRCGVNRLQGKTGLCGIGALAQVASFCDHHGEEPAISGIKGSGTVFLAGCNLRCVYCQNSQISQGNLSHFRRYSPGALAEVFLELQRRGCHNINWVSPTHVVPQLLRGWALAVDDGLRLPLVYNSNGYDSVDVLRLLEGVVDVYLPDLKYADEETARRLSNAPGYPNIAIAAIGEMYRQVGDLQLDENGIARRGVIVRHLVLPNNLAGSREALRQLAREVSPTITVSLMAQYYPAHRAADIPEMHRTITVEEYEEALEAFTDAGLENGWGQEVREAPEYYQPDFAEDHPFER